MALTIRSNKSYKKLVPHSERNSKPSFLSFKCVWKRAEVTEVTAFDFLMGREPYDMMIIEA